MNGKKIKTKLMVLLICFFLLTSINGVSLAATVIDTSIDEKPLEIFEIKELNHAPAMSEYAPGEILVKFKSDIEDGALLKANSGYGTSVKSNLLSGTQVLKIPSDKTVDEMVKIYESLPEVDYAEPNYMVHAFMVPNDTYYPYQWHLDNHVYGGIHMESAWDISNGSGVIVAVIDTGVAQAPDLAGTTFVPGYDFVNGDSNPNDDNGHGTHVAGTIAQTTNNGYGVAGVAFGCSIMPIKVLNATGSGTNAWVANGIYFAVDHGADVISMSLGGPNPSSTIEDAVAHAYNHGVTVIAAAGNEYEEGNAPNYPAAYDAYVIAVGATRYDETRSYYSNTGSYLDLVAPGGDMTVDQNGDGYPDGVLQQTFGGSPPSFGFYFKQGTSMATPHVAGVAALVIAKGITGPDNISALLKSSAEDKGTPGWDEEYGWGLVNAATALRVVQMNISTAVDNYDLNWTTGGTADWFGQTSTYYYGGDAAVSGDISHSQISWMQTNVTGPGNLSFYWKVSSEIGWDYLKFYIDGVEQHAISGDTDWTQKTYSIGSGTHTLKWEYSKDYSISYGEDCGWVDKVEYGGEGAEGNPDIEVDPTSFTVTLNQGDTWSHILQIENQGTATLTYNISDANATASVSSQYKTSKRSIAITTRTSENENNNNEGSPTIPEVTASDVLKQSGTTQILAWVLYTDYDQEYNNTLSAISQYYADYTVTESTTTNPSVLSSELVGKDIFLVPEPEMAGSTTLATMGSTFSTALLDFVNNGGIVIVCCEWSGSQGFLLNAGLMNATYANGYWTGNFTVADSTHPITDGLGSTVAAADAVASYNITDPEIQNLIVDSYGYPVVAVRDLGSGHVVLIGYDYYEYNDDAARIISNAVNLDLWSTETGCAWLTETPTSGSVLPGSYDNITVSINTTGLSTGSYSANIIISSNDPDEGTIVVPVSLTVESPSADPDIWVDPTSFNVTLSTNTAQNYTLTIGNDGNATLTYNLSDANATTSSFAQELMVRVRGLTATEADLSVGSKPSDKSTYTVKYTGLIDGLDILVLGASISSCDYYEVTRINALGANAVLVEDSAIASLTLSDLEGYDVVYLPIEWGYSSDHIESIGDTIKTYLSNGGGLVVGQCCEFDAPYTPSFLPYNLSYTDTWYPGYGVTILNSTHYITQGLNNSDMPDVYDRIPTSTLNANYDLLAVSSVEDVLSLAVAEYGSGRIAVHTSNWQGTGTIYGDDPDVIIERIFYWASQGEAVDGGDSAWTTKTSMPSARFGAAAGVIDGVLYVAGGHDGTTGATSTLQAYNPTTNTWSTLASMPQGRYSGDGAGAINGELYVAGGWNWPASGLPQSQLFVYDPVANSWSTKATMPTLSGNGATGVIGDKLYVTTACDGSSGYRNFLHVYDPATNTWSQLASSPNDHADPAFGVINNKLYVAGGVDDGGVHANLDVYDPATNTWTTKASMPTSLTGLSGGVINGKFYAIGGSSAGVYYDTVYVYDPSTDTWTTETSMPTARALAAAGVINGVIYVAGGTNSTGTLATVEAFTPGGAWLTETPTSGSVLPGSYDNITVSINTTGLSTGSYSANIIISSNDPDEGTIVVPVSLTVSAEEGTGGLETVDLNSGLTPTALANSLMGGGVTVSNVTYSGVNVSAGTFSNGTEIIGFYSGIILSSGNISNVIGPNTYDGISEDNYMPGDADLDTLIPGYDTYDASVLEFDFVPDTDVVIFEYVFGSEEYNEWVHSTYNDVFGFFINGVNHALIPGTSTPVSINNVNGGNPYGINATNSAYYRNNDLDDGGGSINTELDGLTIVLSVTANVNAGETNHIKLAIADAGDYVLDSDVFIRAGSFIAPNLTLSPITATHLVDDINHTLTATLIENGSGVSGRTITFNVTDGPNAGLTGINMTNSNGQATWSYTSSVNGTDTIVATSASETSNNAYVTWVSFIEAFDTGTGTALSISGTHNGTIVMSSHVNVSHMYAYPCAGTGGHAESVKIWNSTWTATATWSGYAGDYHNLTFDEPFILRAGQTYNYTIRTGSYPQIIHATSKAVTGGTITCTQFTDANGVTYNDWIPAIRLE